VSRSPWKRLTRPRAETKRELELIGPSVRLRGLRLEDAARIVELLRDPEVSRFFLWEPPRDRAEAERYVRGFQDEVEAGWAYHFAVVHRASEELLGVANLYHIDGRAGQAEIGIWLGREYWGQGIQQEVSGLLLELGFDALHLRRIIFQVAAGNTRAQAAFRRLGAVERSRAWLPSQRQGQPVEHLVYEVAAKAWRGRQPAISDSGSGRPLEGPAER
jgi:RimJ/RimL family protein N-acetyltransferase